MKKSFALFALSCACVLGVTGCGKSNNNSDSNISSEVKVDGITLLEESFSMDAGTTKQISVDVTPASATNKNVTYVSSDESVAKVDSNGLVTAINNGECVITVKTVDGNYSAELPVNVTGYSLSSKVFAGFSKLENNGYNSSEEGKMDYNVDVSNENYTEITFNRSKTLEWASLVTWYERDVNPTLFTLDVELVKGNLPSILYEFNGELNFKYFGRVPLKLGERTNYTLNTTDVNLKNGDEGAGCWGAVNLELNNPQDSTDTYRTADEEVTLRIYKMALTHETPTVPSKIENLEFDTKLKQIKFDKVFAASEYELEVYKDGVKLDLDTVQTRFNASENIPNMKVTFTPKNGEDFAKEAGNYTCKVRAKNSAGESEWSEASFTIASDSQSTYVATGFANNGLINVGQWNTNKAYTIEEKNNGMEISFTADANEWDSLNLTFDKNTTAKKLKMVFEVLSGDVKQIGVEFADWAESEPEASDGKQQDFFEVTAGKNEKTIDITTDLSKGLGQLNLFLNKSGADAGDVKIVIYSIELLD